MGSGIRKLLNRATTHTPTPTHHKQVDFSWCTQSWSGDDGLYFSGTKHDAREAFAVLDKRRAGAVSRSGLADALIEILGEGAQRSITGCARHTWKAGERRR